MSTARVTGGLPFGFSIVGVQKAATTTLDGLIRCHPQVASPPRKEMHFFDDDSRNWDAPDYPEYVAARTAPQQVIAGDNTARYLFHPEALRRMRRYNPRMGLVAVFRDPIERLFSNWIMMLDVNPEFPDWPTFIRRLRPTSLPKRIPSEHPRRWLSHSGVARGYYGKQLERGFSIFPREQWLLLEFRDLLTAHGSALNRITTHLALDEFAAIPPLRHAKQGPDRVRGTAPTGGDLAELAELYAADLRLFEKLSAIDISEWPTRQILEGRLGAADLAERLATKVIS